MKTLTELFNIQAIATQESIDNLKGNMTIISVAHRLSTIVNSNQIFYLKDGHLIEQGTFN